MKFRYRFKIDNKIVTEIFTLKEIEEGDVMLYPVDILSRDRWTELTDKNGSDIFENDIVRCDQVQGLGYVTGRVHFGIDYRESSGWCDPRIYLDTRSFQKHNGSEFCIFHLQPEVISTIYDTPEQGGKITTVDPNVKITVTYSEKGGKE